jgi:hypothetical protein
MSCEKNELLRVFDIFVSSMRVWSLSCSMIINHLPSRSRDFLTDGAWWFGPVSRTHLEKYHGSLQISELSPRIDLIDHMPSMNENKVCPCTFCPGSWYHQFIDQPHPIHLPKQKPTLQLKNFLRAAFSLASLAAAAFLTAFSSAMTAASSGASFLASSKLSSAASSSFRRNWA